MFTALTLTAPAKINLSLRVTGRRDDGYHTLESLVAFAAFGDTLHLRRARATRFVIDGAGVFADESNLVMRALRCLEAYIGKALPTDIRLRKDLPVAAGLGGGSADAAAMLNGLNKLYNLDLSEAQREILGAKLGADVPACLASGPGWMTGTGVEITRLDDLPVADIVLVNPRIDLPTASVFEALACHHAPPPHPSLPPHIANFAALCDFISTQSNDLEAAAMHIVPEISECLQALRDSGAAYVGMSGSGATCFGLMPPAGGADIAAAYRARRPDDWCVARWLIGPGDAEIGEPYQQRPGVTGRQ